MAAITISEINKFINHGAKNKSDRIRIINTMFNALINGSVNSNTRDRAQKVLKDHNLSLMEFIVNDITMIAKYGLPADYNLSDVGEEKYAEANYKKLPKFKSAYKLMKFLND